MHCSVVEPQNYESVLPCVFQLTATWCKKIVGLRQGIIRRYWWKKSQRVALTLSVKQTNINNSALWSAVRSQQNIEKYDNIFQCDFLPPRALWGYSGYFLTTFVYVFPLETKSETNRGHLRSSSTYKFSLASLKISKTGERLLENIDFRLRPSTQKQLRKERAAN